MGETILSTLHREFSPIKPRLGVELVERTTRSQLPYHRIQHRI